MSLNSYYNNTNKYNNADIINYKYSSLIPKINNSKPNFFPKIHSKYSQKIAPILKTTFGTTPLLSNQKMNKKMLQTQLTHSNYDLPLYSWYLDNKILLDYNLRSNLRYNQFNSLPELQQRQANKFINHNKLPVITKRNGPQSYEKIQYTKDYIQFIRNKPLQLKPINGFNNNINTSCHPHNHQRENKKEFDFSFDWYTPTESEFDEMEDIVDNDHTNKLKTSNNLTKQNDLNIFNDDSLLNFNQL